MSYNDSTKSSLKELSDNIPSDISGSMSSNRYGFQENWALKKLLELENENKDYIIILDYHEDVVVIDKSVNEKNIDFFQVKTKNGDNWKVSELYSIPARKDGNNGHSILGKLLQHSFEFKQARAYFFVTDSYFGKTQLADPSKSGVGEIRISDFKKDKQVTLRDKVLNELPNLDKNVLENFHILQKEIPGNYEISLRGIISNFIEKMGLKDVSISVGTFYEHLMDEIIRKQHKEGIITEENILKTEKAITKEEFSSHVKEIADNKYFETVINEISLQLEKENMPFMKKIRILKPIREKVHDALFDYNNAELISLKGKIKNQINYAMETEENENISFTEFTNKVFCSIKKNYTNTLQYDDDFILALIMYYYAKN